MWVLVEREVAAGTIDGPFFIAIDAKIEETQEGDASIDDLKESIVAYTLDLLASKHQGGGLAEPDILADYFVVLLPYFHNKIKKKIQNGPRHFSGSNTVDLLPY